MLQLNHAPHNGAIGENGKRYTGGEFMPFYKPRVLMPQVDDKAYPALRDWLTRNGIAFWQGEVSAWDLRPHQRIDARKAGLIPEQVLRVPLLTSADRFILDGNHRWFAHIRQNVDACRVLCVGLEFDPAIAALFQFLKDNPSGTLEKELSVTI